MSPEGTQSERYLTRLCRRSFLRLWSWPHVYRDQRWTGGEVGKEVCGLLVVFGQQVFIFSDKECAFPDTGDLPVAWSRWFKRAVLKSAQQVWGAERWIQERPDRLFLDSSCSLPLPCSLPSADSLVFHRIVVAHGAGLACQHHLGGSGSFLLCPDLVGRTHYTPSDPAFIPFAVGVLDSSEGFVHVMDDATLDIVLETVDTVSDLVRYFTRKEQLTASGRLGMVAGEENLLAHYLAHIGADGQHDFVLPKGTYKVSIDDGLWNKFSASSDRRAQLKADEISYSWDRLIDRFAHLILGGGQYVPTEASIADQETMLRFMAREPRVRRRMLSKSLVAILKRADAELRSARVIQPTNGDDPYYVFLALKPPAHLSLHEYRQRRLELLRLYCMVTRLDHEDARHVVGVATEHASYDGDRTEDLIYLDGTEWNEEMADEARQAQEQLGILTLTRTFHTSEPEYPRKRDAEYRKGRNRNQPCPCGSGKKYKKCCGRGQPPVPPDAGLSGPSPTGGSQRR